MGQARYIAIEGPIGVGKTSLAERLAGRLGGLCVLEAVEENPFLRHFYRDIRRYAFQTQLFFLLSRYRQQLDLAQYDLFSQFTLSDYLFAKDQIFAHLNLDEDELRLYQEVYRLLRARIPVPDLVVFLQANTEVLLERIRGRRRDYEDSLSPDYVERLNQAYNDYFFHYRDTPLLVVNTEGTDFVHREEEFEDLVKEILQMRQGTKAYVSRARGP